MINYDCCKFDYCIDYRLFTLQRYSSPFILLWQWPLADAPGCHSEAPTLHQSSAHWHGINTGLQM